MIRRPPPPATQASREASAANALVAQILSESYQAQDLTQLVRLIYVRVLFRIAKVANGKRQSGQMGKQITAQILTAMLGYHFDAEEVEKLLDEDEAPAKKDGEGDMEDVPPPTPNRAKGNW